MTLHFAVAFRWLTFGWNAIMVKLGLATNSTTNVAVDELLYLKCVWFTLINKTAWLKTVASLEGCGGGGPPRVTPSMGWHPKEKILWANLQRIVEKRGRTGKKSVGWHPRGGDTRVHEAMKSDSDSDSDEQKKGRQVFQEKIKGWHPQLPPRVSPVTHPSDVTEISVDYLCSFLSVDIKICF